MSGVAVVCVLAALAAPAPLSLDVERERDALTVRFELRADLPVALEEALPSGAVVRVVYPLRVRSLRKLIWDKRLWRGEAIASASFDPVTGRYRCELILDDVIVASQETESASVARTWLVAPPAVRLALPAGKREEDLRVRIRAVFSSSTTWLIFPSVEGTEWVEVPVVPGPSGR